MLVMIRMPPRVLFHLNTWSPPCPGKQSCASLCTEVAPYWGRWSFDLRQASQSVVTTSDLLWRALSNWADNELIQPDYLLPQIGIHNTELQQTHRDGNALQEKSFGPLESSGEIHEPDSDQVSTFRLICLYFCNHSPFRVVQGNSVSSLTEVGISRPIL